VDLAVASETTCMLRLLQEEYSEATNQPAVKGNGRLQGSTSGTGMIAVP